MCTWLQGQIPPHPFFEKEERIKKIAINIKTELFSYLVSGLVKFKNELKLNYRLYKILEEHPLCWDLAIKSLRYGVIYWLSRDEAKQHSLFTKKYKNVIDDIANFIEDGKKINRIMNYAVHCFVLNKRRTLRFSNEFIPKYAIYSTGPNQIYVREADFIQRTPEDSFHNTNALYDLHDFAHALTASLNPELYGSYYFNHLVYLPKQLHELIKSPHYKTCKANPFSDGLVFSEILTSTFNALDYNNLAYKDLILIMANTLALFYLNKAALLQGSTGHLIQTHRVISLEELATLVQNKAYELPASEVEQKLFTRGGENGRDPLQDLKASERIIFLANSNKWLYFEMRNTLKHKAHKEAYKIVANTLLNSSNSKLQTDLLNKIIDNINYADFYRNKRSNLWRELRNPFVNSLSHQSKIFS